MFSIINWLRIKDGAPRLQSQPFPCLLYPYIRVDRAGKGVGIHGAEGSQRSSQIVGRDDTPWRMIRGLFTIFLRLRFPGTYMGGELQVSHSALGIEEKCFLQFWLSVWFDPSPVPWTRDGTIPGLSVRPRAPATGNRPSGFPRTRSVPTSQLSPSQVCRILRCMVLDSGTWVLPLEVETLQCPEVQELERSKSRSYKELDTQHSNYNLLGSKNLRSSNQSYSSPKTSGANHYYQQVGWIHILNFIHVGVEPCIVLYSSVQCTQSPVLPTP